MPHVLTLLVVLSVAVVLFLAAAVATSDSELLVEVAPDSAGAALPPRRVAAGDVDALRFGLAVRGYRMDEVDRALTRLAQEVAERDARIAELEHAIAEAVAPAVDGVEEHLARERQQQEERERAQAEAELAAARDEAANTGPSSVGTVAPWITAAGTATVPPARWAANEPEPEPLPEPAPEPLPEPVVTTAGEPHAPAWPAAEPTHPEPVVPASVLAEREESQDAAPSSAAVPTATPTAAPAAPAATEVEERPREVAPADLFGFPEVAAPERAEPAMPESREPRDDRYRSSDDDDEDDPLT